MYVDRIVDKILLDWSLKPEKKPILLRGARQIGKSTSVRQLGTKFNYFLEINFEESIAYSQLFEQNFSVDEICEQLSILFKTPIIDGETLIFFDEIQSCVAAISALRYFYEKKPNLHVIAAGSLLEFALEELPSFGVGRIRSVYMYPLTFGEFLNANGEYQLNNYLANCTEDKPLPELLYQRLNSYYKKYLLIGGMPEVVQSYVQNKDLLEVQRILNDLIISLQDDFSKYKRKIENTKILEVFSAIVNQIGSKFTYSYPNASLNNNQVKQILNLLEMAGLILKVSHSSANGIPLAAEINPKKTKYLIFDTGIFQRLLGLDLKEYILNNDFNSINKGGLAELFVGLELVKNTDAYEKTQLFYWQREAKNSQAEVDYLIQQGREIIPLEVKSGTKGSMQSLYLFLKEKNQPFGYRFSLENFSKIEGVKIFPLYAVSNLFKNYL